MVLVRKVLCQRQVQIAAQSQSEPAFNYKLHFQYSQYSSSQGLNQDIGLYQFICPINIQLKLRRFCCSSKYDVPLQTSGLALGAGQTRKVSVVIYPQSSPSLMYARAREAHISSHANPNPRNANEFKHC